MAIESRLNIIKIFAGSKWGGHPLSLLSILKSVVRSKIEYGCTIYGKANQTWLNKINVKYNKGLRMCLRSLKSTTISALETEAGSIPLPIRREYLARKQILKTFVKKFPMKERWERLEYRLDGY